MDDAERAIETAITTVRAIADSQELGSVEAWTATESPAGRRLSIKFRSGRHGGRLLHYARIIWPNEPDKDPETAGMLFGSAFAERLIAGKLDE